MQAVTSVRKEISNVLRGQDILCFSHDWTGDPLSKTHLMRILSRDNRILWVNAIANRAPTVSSKDLSRVVFKLKSFLTPVREVEKNIFVLNPLAVPSYSNSAIRSFNRKFLLSQVRRAMRSLKFKSPTNMVFNPAAGLLAGKLGESQLIYYCVDAYTEFSGASKGLKEIEEDLMRKADAVIVSSEPLLENKKEFNPNTFLIRHGTDWHHFHAALDETVQIPDEVIRLPRPIIGFHGLLADWVDFELIKKVAAHFSGGSVVLLGKVAVDAVEKIKVLKNISNVHMLGRKPYSALPAFCKSFDVALNPFLINELTLSANPLKVREYLAAGLMTVSTDIPEVRVLGDCLIGKDHQDFIRQIEWVLKHPKPRAEISAAIRHESWDSRIGELRQILADQITENGAQP